MGSIVGFSTPPAGASAESREPAGAGAPVDSRVPAGTGRLRNGNPPGDLSLAARCGARTRAGPGCRQPAMRNGRCRLHGGKSTGPRTANGLARCRGARLRHGGRGAGFTALRREGMRLRRGLRALFAEAAARLALDEETAVRAPNAVPAPVLAPDCGLDSQGLGCRE